MPDSPQEQTSTPLPMVDGAGPLGSLFARAYPPALKEEEEKLLKKRREAAGVQPGGPDSLAVGLSGGGIRSATFCLGVFQAMARRPGLLRRIDYLSTVSGGGYFGSFLGRLLSRRFIEDAGDLEKTLRGEENTGVLKYLRENGRYLSPNGAGDMLLGGAVVLRNWLSIHLILALFVLALFLVLQALRIPIAAWSALGKNGSMQASIEGLAAGSIWVSPYVVLPVIVFFLAAFPLGWAYWLVRPISRAVQEGAGSSPRRRAHYSWWSLLASLLIGISLPLIKKDLGVPAVWAVLAVVAAMTAVWWGIAKLVPLPGYSARRGQENMDQALYYNQAFRHRLSVWLTWALTITGVLLGLALIDSLGQTAYVAVRRTEGLWAWIAGLFSSLVVLAGFARRIAMFFSKGGGKDERPRLPLRLVATVAALLLVVLHLVTFNAVSHALAWALETPATAPAGAGTAKADDGLSIQVKASRGDLPLRLDFAEDGADVSPQDEPRLFRSGTSTLLGLAATFVLSWLFGNTFSFVNNSSHHPLYTSRLTRAYLGASNEERWKRGRSVTQALEDDDLDLGRYWPPPANKGMPLHLINVTINETVDGRSQVQQQDRKGVGMAVGPCGLSAGIDHHAVITFGHPDNTDPFGSPVTVYPEKTPANPSPYRMFEYPPGPEGKHVFRGEVLPLGDWVGISGAAFSTGTGHRTSLGLSLLAGFANVRIGRWWDSGVDPQRRQQVDCKLGVRSEHLVARLFPVQVYLLDEFFARFHGSARQHWYLSDGGHFENLAGYELIRRRLPRIVILDAEQDADYTFEGLANLILKARLDFGAEIQFMNEDELDHEVDAPLRPYIGTLQQLRRGKWEREPLGQRPGGPRGRLLEAGRSGFSLVHAALARITYRFPEQAESRLLYVKPTLTGNEPVDVLKYHSAHPDFPHESTGDQFFDESQWESYRKLGEHIGGLLFP